MAQKIVSKTKVRQESCESDGNLVSQTRRRVLSTGILDTSFAVEVSAFYYTSVYNFTNLELSYDQN